MKMQGFTTEDNRIRILTIHNAGGAREAFGDVAEVNHGPRRVLPDIELVTHDLVPFAR